MLNNLHSKKTIVSILAGVALSSFIIGLRHQGSFEQIELLAYDSLVRLDAKSDSDKRITIVGIDDDTLRTLNSDKISDSTLKQVLETIRQYEPRVIGVDVIRDIPIGKGREELLNYVNEIYQPLEAAIKPIIFSCALPSANKPKGIAPPSVIDVNSGVGFVDLATDPQNIFGGELIRRALISSIPVDIGLETVPESQFDAESPDYLCTTPFSFGFLTALSYVQAQQLETLSPNSTPDIKEFIDLSKITEGEIRFKSLTLRPLQPKTGSYHRLDPSVYQHLIDYRYTQPGEIISLTKVLENKVTPQQFKDKVVLIGYTTKEDIHQTPFGLRPGVLVHGWIVGQFLSNVLDEQPQIWTWPEPVEWLWILGWGIAGSILALGIRPVGIFVGSQGIAIALLWGGCWFLFTQQGWIPLIPPVFSLAIAGIAVKAISSQWEKEDTLSFSPPVVTPPTPTPQPTLVEAEPPTPQPTLVEEESFTTQPQPTYVENQASISKAPRRSFIRQDPFVGKSIGDGDRYLLDKLLGQGGMSKVYIGLDQRLNNKKVAIKIMTSYFSSNDQYLIKRFMREVQDLCILNHPNIIQITDYGLTPKKSPFSGYPFYVMQYFVGQTLQKLLNENKTLSLKLALQIIFKVCHGLKEAHKQGIIHRDLKPDNIFLISGGEVVKLIDFGIAKKIDEESKQNTQLTVAGTFLGTYRYASPEQCLGASIDSKTDIYSLGMVLYEILSGNNPYNLKNDSNTTNADWSVAHRRENPIPLREQPACQNIPVELENIVMKCLSKSPQDRFQTIEELEQALAKYL